MALLTTAAGLAVAMPTGLALTWLEARVAAERLWAEAALARLRAPGLGAAAPDRPLPAPPRRAAHAG